MILPVDVTSGSFQRVCNISHIRTDQANHMVLNVSQHLELLQTFYFSMQTAQVKVNLVDLLCESTFIYKMQALFAAIGKSE